MKTIPFARNVLFAVFFSAAGTLALPSVSGMISSAHAVSFASLPDFADLSEKTGPAVVNIRTTERVKPWQDSGIPGGEDEEMQEFFRRFFGMPIPRQPESFPRNRNSTPAPQQEREVPRGVGSGFIIS